MSGVVHVKFILQSKPNDMEQKTDLERDFWSWKEGSDKKGSPQFRGRGRTQKRLRNQYVKPGATDPASAINQQEQL